MKTFLLIQVPVQIVLLIVAVVVGLIGGFILAFTAPLHSPGWVEELMCPPGTTIDVDSYQASYNEPGERTLTVSCVDAGGTSVPAQTDAGMLALITRFSLICVGSAFCPFSLLVLIVGAFLSFRRRKPAGVVS